jgi:small redox-active disulfide protein 2
MEIKILGPGCPKCDQTAKQVKDAVADAGIDANIEKITDFMAIASYGVFGTPAVIVDGDVKSVGKVPTIEEIKKWLEK